MQTGHNRVERTIAKDGRLRNDITFIPPAKTVGKVNTMRAVDFKAYSELIAVTVIEEIVPGLNQEAYTGTVILVFIKNEQWMNVL